MDTTRQLDHPLTPPTPLPSRATSGSSLRAFGAVLWRRRMLMALVIVLVAGSTALGLALVEREYTATARVAVTPAQDAPAAAGEYVDLLGTVADVMASRPMLEEVADAVPSRSVRDLQESVSGDVVAGTFLVQVSVSDADPVLAAQIANAVAQAIDDYDPTGGTLRFDTTAPAEVPRSFSSPNIEITVLAALALALALAIAVAVVYDRLTRTVETVEEVTNGTGIGVLGVIPQPQDPEAIAALDPDAAEFGSLRSLRVALEFASSDHPTRSLVVAGAATDPWSGWLEVNLAVALAEVGHRVLLLDAHRTDRHRHPVLEDGGDAGFYDMLAGSATFEEAIRSGPVDGVTVMPLGNAHLAAPSLLEMRFRQLLESIDGEYDVVIIHAPAVTDSDDARIMAIDGSLLLTLPSGRVSSELLLGAVEDLHEARTRVLGAVLLGGRGRQS